MTKDQNRSQRPDRRQPGQNSLPSQDAAPRPLRLPQRKVDPLADPWADVSLPHPTGRSTALASPTVPPEASPSWLDRAPWLRKWQLWLTLGIVVCTGSGALALALLLHLPALPNCPAIFWPFASASMRMQCAQIAASKQTAQDLLEAIKLVDSLPSDHPLRAEADRLVELWSTDVLNLAEETFHNGKLPEAIAAARQIPAKAAAAKLVAARVQRWEKVWSQAEVWYQKAEAALRKMDWREAFSFAVRLTDVDNRYWQTTKYEELSAKITQTREDGNKLGRAERLADSGGSKGLLDAIKLAQSISPDSLLFERAQKLLPKFANQLIDLAEARLNSRDLAGTLAILDQLPDVGTVKEQAKDLTVLANAQSQVWKDSISSMEEAIAQAQRIGRDRPMFAKAQRMIAQWQLEIEALSQLEKARVLAQGGTMADLTAAIAQASQISSSNPRWRQVNQEVSGWTKQVQSSEDRPILDQAMTLAASGDVNALQAAITVARNIGPGRALSSEAQAKIADWTGQIQRYEDQPTVDRARALAGVGDLNGAIATAQSIGAGRSLSAEAQADIRTWQKQIQSQAVRGAAQQSLESARSAANSASADGLIRAIQLAGQVPTVSDLRTEAEGAIAEWSNQLLAMADSQANYDLPGAIRLAQRIPAGTAAYTQAQQRLATWQKSR
jgi:hypothetical protein